MSLLLGPHGICPALAGVPEAGLLDDAAAGLDDLDLALDLVLQRGTDEAEGVDVLHLGLGAELLRPQGRTDTFASHRNEPSSMLQSETAV